MRVVYIFFIFKNIYCAFIHRQRVGEMLTRKLKSYILSQNMYQDTIIRFYTFPSFLDMYNISIPLVN